MALNCFLQQKCVSKMTKGKKGYCHSKITDESNPSPKRQEEDIVNPKQRMSPRKGRPEDKEGMNPSNPSPKEPEPVTAYQYAVATASPNAQHQGSKSPLYSIDYTGDPPPPNAAQVLQELHCEELASQQPSLDCITPR